MKELTLNNQSNISATEIHLMIASKDMKDEKAAADAGLISVNAASDANEESVEVI